MLEITFIIFLRDNPLSGRAHLKIVGMLRQCL